MGILKHEELTYKIIGCGMKVFEELGNGYQELIYQRALAIEIETEKPMFVREASMDIFYKNNLNPIGSRRVDFLVGEKVVIELKATTEFKEEHKAQLLNYLKVFKIEIGLLFNFGSKTFQVERFILSST
ncbi:MAG: GxxExxY protein [Cyclobacteriaceae bacterium]|nr:GxxExxY protein [Cyclobacteriaceae bacterium]